MNLYELFDYLGLNYLASYPCHLFKSKWKNCAVKWKTLHFLKGKTEMEHVTLQRICPDWNYYSNNIVRLKR